MSKADYVRSQGQTRKHHCHWPGCTKQVPPAMWGCSAHWFSLPAALRAKVWHAYCPGQEVNATPTAAYLAVAQEVQDWIAARAKPAASSPKASALPQPESEDGSTGNCIHCGKECCNDLGWCNSFKTARNPGGSDVR